MQFKQNVLLLLLLATLAHFGFASLDPAPSSPEEGDGAVMFSEESETAEAEMRTSPEDADAPAPSEDPEAAAMARLPEDGTEAEDAFSQEDTDPCAEEAAEAEAESAEYVVTEHKSEESEAFLWECISKHSPNDRITAGILAYFWRESYFRSDSPAGWDVSLDKDLAETFTAEVDAGLADGSSREYFIKKARRFGGYGLGQWSSPDFLEGLYDFAQAQGTSISDAEMQVAFTVESMKENEELWEMLLESNDTQQIARDIAVWYDGTSTGAGSISAKALTYYKKYAA